MTTLRKIDAMHKYYGFGAGKCENCQHFRRKVFDRTYHKCLVYGDSNSEATDWRCGYAACGLIDKPFPEDEIRIVERIEREKVDDGPLPGQIAMEI
jgi:hypothetical protein